MKLKKRSNTLLIIILIISISIPSTIVSVLALSKDDNQQNIVWQTDEDRNIAAQISNMTGIPIEQVLAIKSEGKTWNEILEILEIEDVSVEELEQRENTLLQTGISEELIQSLISQGYLKEDILDAKMLIERVISQLQDIIEENQLLINSKYEYVSSTESDEISEYEELYGKIDVEKAITLMLALKKDFGTIEEALDEYLYSIQIGIDLNKYLADKKAYEEDRKLKSVEINEMDIITIAKIEEKVLELIQLRNINSIESIENTPEQLLEKEQEIPNTPLPEINPRPQDPLQDVMKEIEDITNNSFYPN